MTPTIETKILANLFSNEPYVRKVLPYLKEEYFHDQDQKIIFQLAKGFVDKHNKLPTKDILRIELDEQKISEEAHKTACELLTHLDMQPELNLDWFIKKSEAFCQDKAVYNGIMDAIEILDGRNKTLDKGMIPSMLQNAIAVSFDNNVGHDFLADAQARYDFYHRPESRLPFHIEKFNKATNGGVQRKTLNVIVAGIHVGKSLMMCDFASANLLEGKNVLYITCEMAAEKIAERIDANLFDIDIGDVSKIPLETFQRKIEKITQKTHGRLIIKEYPTATANVTHFRALLNELSLKKQFKPDIIYIDYLNICASARFKAGSANATTYVYIKAIAEELRGLAQEYNVPIWSATQVTRAGFGSSDPGMDDVAESFGLPATADFMIGVTQSDEMKNLEQYQIVQMKNRYEDMNRLKKFIVGVDKRKMRLYDIEDRGQLGGFSEQGNSERKRPGATDKGSDPSEEEFEYKSRRR